METQEKGMRAAGGESGEEQIGYLILLYNPFCDRKLTLNSHSGVPTLNLHLSPLPSSLCALCVPLPCPNRTQQHSCGDVNGNSCEIIMQYTCNDKWTRDGTTTRTIPITAADCTDANGNCDEMIQYGRHESVASYYGCRYRSRNLGLFLANQRMRGTSARFTRQNNNGARSGLECPEERDYYPYHHPTIWRDVAILTNRPDRCLAFQKESQNVKARYYCKWDPTVKTVADKLAKNSEGWVPITQSECEAASFGGTWTRVESWGLPPPDCIQAPFTRDNHLGNAVSNDPNADTNGYPSYYNWTIPSESSAHCVFRIRYNISTGEFENQGFSTPYDVQAGIDSTSNMVPLASNNVDNNARYPSMFPIWERFGLTYSEVNGSFTKIVQTDDPDDDAKGGRLGGIRKAQPPSRDYTFRNNPQVDIFGSLLPTNASSIPAYYGQPMIRVRLAIDTAQFGRTFEDRSHVFEIRKRPSTLANVKIHNLSVRGKRGNIVQVYPGVEYDFVPEQLRVAQGDFVHIQWTGSAPSEDEGQGTKGDRSNLIMLHQRNYKEDGQDENPIVPNGAYGNAYPALINTTDNGNPTFLGLDFIRLRMLALYGLNSSHFDLGPVQATRIGEYRYFCTRNNAFSNRSQKGLLIVDANATWQELGPEGIIQGPVPVSTTGETSSPSGAAVLKQAYYDGTLLVPGSVTVDDESDDWVKVYPPIMDLGVNENMLWLETTRPMPSNFFYKGKIEWKLEADDEPVELALASGFYDANNKIALTDGGYYRSSSVPNTALIAGVTIGIVGLIAIFVFLYWKVRVQPEGGWKAFLHRHDAPASEESQFSNMMQEGPSSSAATI